MNDETKRCPKCELDLPVERYNKRANGRCIAYCKACQSLYARNHYLQNTDAYSAKRLRSNRKIYARNRVYLIEHLRKHPCVDCGERDPIVLEFDHVDRASKDCEVSSLTRTASSIERLASEIAKCEVRCARCHRRRTAKQFGWDTNAS